MNLRGKALLRGFFAFAIIASSSGFGAPVAAQPVSPLEPASTGGAARVDRALARLSQHRRLLVIAAHPDDEDTRLLAAVARGMGGEAGYLSLTRGEGGQNLIGAELGDGLGLLRSHELQAARAIDGAQQFFSRAYDFGYTRSRQEALERWRETELLEDIVRVIRRFRPQVLVTVWTPDARAGHGQHQAAGLITPKAFALSRDRSAFATLTAEGLPPWPVSALYRPVRDAPGERRRATVSFGGIDPISGRSVLQLALASRSQHRSQDMGTLQPLGDSMRHYERLDDGKLAGPIVDSALGDSALGDSAARDTTTDGQPTNKGLFAGIDTRLQAIADLLAPGRLRDDVSAQLSAAGHLAIAARASLVPAWLDASVPALRDIVESLARARDLLIAAPTGVGTHHALFLIEEKHTIASEALAAAAGVAVDTWTDHETLVPGSKIDVTAVVWNAGTRSLLGPIIETDSRVGLALVATAEVTADASPRQRRFRARPTHAYRLTMTVPDRARLTIPYFLERPRRGDLYDWDGAPRGVRGRPFEAPPLRLRFRLEIEGTPVILAREVVARQVDQAMGEVRHPLRVVPRFEIRLTPALIVWPLGARQETTLEVEITSHADEAETVQMQIAMPAGWPAFPPRSVRLDPGEKTRVSVTIRPPLTLGAGRFVLDAAVLDADGKRYDRAIEVVDYPHVRASTLPRPASTSIRAAAIELPRVARIAYLRGASARVPEALKAIGLPVEVYDGATLQQVALDAFDVVVVGSRAYETDPALAALNRALLDYAKRGGAVIVLYQQYAFARGGFAPYPLEIHRPHDRATDETTPVRALAPAHRLLHTPNEIGAQDWEEWVQERGLYFAGTWDDAYTPIVAMADPEGVERSGALLVAKVGEGWYVYTGLAFFRQLPAGVAGAYRLFANLLALGAEE